MFLRARLDNKHQPLMDRVMCAFAVDHQRFEAFGKWALANAPALGIVPGPDDSDLLAGSRLLNWLPTTHLTEDTAQSYAFILYHLAEGLEGRLERLRIQPILEALWGNRPHTH